MSKSAKQFMHELAVSMGKKPNDMDNFIQILEDNWLDTEDSLKTITDEQWQQLKFPMGLVNAIKKRFAEQNQYSAVTHYPQLQQQISQPKVSEKQIDKDTEMIDTSSGATPSQREEMKKDETIDFCLCVLSDLVNDEMKGNIAQQRDTIKTLATILTNLIAKPLDPQVGFDFDKNPEQVELGEYKKDILQSALEAINLHIMSMGGQIENNQPVFDPYKSSLSSTTNEPKIPVQKGGQIDSYDPTAVNSEIQKIQQQRQKALEQTKITDRDIKVFNIQHTGQNFKSYLMELDMKEAERLRLLKISEDKMDEAIENTQALKFLAENEKNNKFRNKRQEELDKLQKRQVYTTSLIRIRFPDDYVIQGTFGGLEKVSEVYQLVKDHLFIKDRPFYLYETPPKKVLTDLEASLKRMKMVPSGMLYFAWQDLDQTKNTDGPFLDIAKVKDKIISF